MLKEDSDINIDKDSLNRVNFAQNLALNIQNYFNRSDINNCLTIGLMGEWGSGKTSLLNMAENFLKDSDIKIIKFNPWLYSSYNQLVEQFFDELIWEFTDSKDNYLRGYFRRYKSRVNKWEFGKKLVISASYFIHSKVGSGMEHILKYSSEERNLTNLKKKIDAEFTGRKVLCIIDDLDRLSKDEIAEMFKLIKIMADFKNMIYLVAFDKDVIAEALKKDYGGEKYIEKIINVPLKVPSIDYSEIEDSLVKHFKRISREYKIDLDLGRLNQFLDFQHNQYGKRSGILYFFKNMRDIIRFINILEFNLELVNGDVNFVDFIVITAIQVFFSEVYDKIKTNEFLLINYHFTIVDEFNKEIITNEKSEFEEMVNGNENLKHILQIMFPKMMKLYINRTSFKFDNEDYADKNLFICHPNHFKAYFKLNSVIKDLSESEIDFIVEYINSKNDASLVLEFTRLYKENKLEKFFETIKNRVDKIYKNKFFLNFLFTIETKMWPDIFFSNRSQIENLCLELIYRIGNKDRFVVLKELYQNSNNVILLFDLLKNIKNNNYMPYTYGEMVLTDEEIIELTGITKDKFIKIERNSFFVENRLGEILAIGLNLDLENKNNDIIDELISTSSGILKLLSYFLPLNEDSSFLLKNIKELNTYISLDELKNLIDGYESIKDEQIVKNFLKGYDMFKNQ